MGPLAGSFKRSYCDFPAQLILLVTLDLEILQCIKKIQISFQVKQNKILKDVFNLWNKSSETVWGMQIIFKFVHFFQTSLSLKGFVFFLRKPKNMSKSELY